MRPPQNVPAWPVDKQTVEHTLHVAQLLDNALAQRLVFAQGLRLDTTHNLLALVNQLIQLLVAANVELPEPREELRQVFHGRVAEDLGLAVALAAAGLAVIAGFAAWRALGDTAGGR